MKPDQPLDLVLDAIDLALAFSSCKSTYRKCRSGRPLIPDRDTADPDFFRQLLVLPSDESRDLQRPPLIELLCGYLRTRHPEASDTVVSRENCLCFEAPANAAVAEQHATTPRALHLFHNVRGRGRRPYLTWQQLFPCPDFDLLPRRSVREDLGSGHESRGNGRVSSPARP
jgi:hypothetical protein